MMARGVGEMARGRNAGWTLLELLVALALSGVVMAGATSLFVAVGRQARMGIVRGERADGARLVRIVLREELRESVPRRDWQVDPIGVLRLRAFRVEARVCGGRRESGGTRLAVEVQGIRRPDVSKDSVLLLLPKGEWVEGRLERVGSGTTGCGASREEWTVVPAPETTPIFARVFESGAYHLSDGALRYERGAGGRQPLTPALWDASGTGWTGTPSDLRVQLASGLDTVVMRIGVAHEPQ